MMANDKLLLLRMIKTGDYTISLQLHENLTTYTREKIVYILNKDLQSQTNYALAKRLGNILLPQKGKLKVNLINLIASELNYYVDRYQRNQSYQKINAYITTLVGFPPNKRIKKFMTKFMQASKVLQAIAADRSTQLEILKIIQNITLEIRNVISEPNF